MIISKKSLLSAIVVSALFFQCSSDKSAEERQTSSNEADSARDITQVEPLDVNEAAWKEASFEVVSPGYETFRTADLGHPFSGRINSIVRIAPEIDGFTGIKLPADAYEKGNADPLKLKFEEPVKVLIGTFQEQAYPKLEENENAKLVLENGITFTGMPPVNVYAVSYPEGVHEIKVGEKGLFTVLGVVEAEQPLEFRNSELLDGREYEPFIIEGFSEEESLFEIVGGPDEPVVDEGMPGTEGIQGGFEGGRCVKIGDTYHMFPTERVGEPGVEAYHDRVKTRIGHWTSKDAINWTRQSTIYESSGTYAITEDDHPINDRRSAIWSFMPIFSEEDNRWHGFYLAYTTHKEIAPNHSFGRIWRAESVQEGIEGIGGPYEDKGIVIEPGLNSQPWEGRQGVASFFPYKVDGDQWLAFYSGAFPYESWADYPKNTGKGWYVGLAEADSLEGPWVRMDTTVNPITSMHPWFIENPIVSQLPNGLYIAIYDGGPDAWGLHLPNMFGYSLSKDGYNWSQAHYFPIRTKVEKWWDIMRTPLCLIPEGDDIYTIVYAAIDEEKRFHPMGMVKVKLKRDVLDKKLQQL